MKVHSSYIYVRNLRCHAYHGVMPQEHVIGNDYRVNVCIAYNIGAAMLSDMLTDTISYACVCDIIKIEMAEVSQLLENVAYRIGRHLFRQFPNIEKIDIDIAKINPPMGADCDCAGVELHLINDKTL